MFLSDKWSDATQRLRQFAYAEVAKLDRRSLGLEAEVAGGRLTVGATRDFLAVHPQAHFAIDGADLVVVPLVYSFGGILRWETAIAVGCNRREWFHFGILGGEHIAV